MESSSFYQELRVVFAGDSNVDRLMQAWLEELPSRHTNMVCRLIGGSGARLRYGDGVTFKDMYVKDIISFQPHLVIVWLAGNDLNQDMRYGNRLMIDNSTHVFNDYIALCNAISAGIAPLGRLVMMPQFPRRRLWYRMTRWDFFCQVRSFNIRFRRRRIGADRAYQLRGMFHRNGRYLCEDGVHLSYVNYWAIALDLFEQYVAPLYAY